MYIGGAEVTFTSRCEHDRCAAMARARYESALAALPSLPAWDDLFDVEREQATRSARTWLEAGIAAGMIPPCPVQDQEGQQQ